MLSAMAHGEDSDVALQRRRIEQLMDNDPPRRVAVEVNTRMAYHDFLSFERDGTRAGLRGLRQAVRRG